MVDRIRRGERGKQQTWQWLMVLLAHRGLCVYCGRRPATTIDHERPVVDDGADVWWNFVPACEDCNRWKKGRSAKRWVVDMDLHHRYPKAGFATRAMPPRIYAGITRRVERVQREIADADRREWFRLHYGREKHRNKTELFTILDRCRAELRGYPHHPWRTPTLGTSDKVCTRLICCGYRHPQAEYLVAFLAPEERTAFRRAVFNERAHEGDVLGRLVREYLAGRERDRNQDAAPLSGRSGARVGSRG
ncbi:HNH endonuclease [Streptomyces sp. NRRL S-87]|uniref:HNH endonuclease n=1 Tax=Streptomyces sp. NRRL S-87 TaxID=1463920 RepID=UPI000568DD80|nr:HNH endonuclease signature motif containing protein [Streptomyces sp. NRRL S-87]